MPESKVQKDPSVASAPRGVSIGVSRGPVDLTSLLDANVLGPGVLKNVVSWDALLEGTLNVEEVQPTEPVLFSKLIKKSQTGATGFVHPEIEFYTKFIGPYSKETPLVELSKKPGLVPINNVFHFASHRTRKNSGDDGLEDEDLIGPEGVLPRDQPGQRKKKSFTYETHKMTKGEFIFPHRTFRPKVQVAYRVPPGEIPQAVAVERLHRQYKKTDINYVCQNLGIEITDLIPPPHYGETNERFYQESMFRNRVKISGMDKREYIRTGGGKTNEDEPSTSVHQEIDISQQSLIKESSASSSSESSESSTLTYDEEEEAGDLSTHPFIRAKPPFGAQLPLEFFDNEEFDIRSGEEWISLGEEPEEKKMYPIPGKAFLPMPPASKQGYPSLSEATSINLLKKTEILERFRKWLVKERFKRQLESWGAGSKDVEATDEEMHLIARATSTVPTMVMSPKRSAAKKSGGSSEPDEEKVEQLRARADSSYITELDGDHISDHSPDAKLSDDSMMIKTLSQRNIDYTKSYTDSELLRVPVDIGDDQEEFKRIMAELTGADQPEESRTRVDSEHMSEEDLLKRSGSLLSTLLSDPDLAALTPDMARKVSNAMRVQQKLEAGSHVSQKDLAILKDLTHSIASAIAGPNSPDIDPFDENGFERLVYEYSKMKKTHNYDWKWVEVAVFDYSPKTRMYFVRSIFKPFVFAWVNKIYLVFDGEDPNKQAERIKDAIIRRIQVEYIMRYNLYIDCLPVDKAPDVEDDMRDQIALRATAGKHLTPEKQKDFDRVLKEMTLEYKRAHMKLMFEHIVQRHPKAYKPWVHAIEPWFGEHKQVLALPENFPLEIDWFALHQRYLECATENFKDRVEHLQKISIGFTPEPYAALKEIVEICLQAKGKPLILTHLKESLDLDKYREKQAEQLLQVLEYLRKEWMENILHSIRTNIGKMPRSWYYLEENRWDLFEISKTTKFLTLVRFMAEDTLRQMVEDSLQDFVKDVEELTAPCEKTPKTYRWGNDLKNSDFPPPDNRTPPFLLHLTMEQDGPKIPGVYTELPTIVVSVFNSSIDASGGFLDITQLIMKNLLFGTKKFLRSVEQFEPKVAKLREHLLKYLARGLIPVNAYRRLYSGFTALYNADVEEFTQTWEETPHSVEEVKAAVDQHKRQKKQLDREIPSFIDICAFRVDIEGVRTALLAKKDELANATLKSFSKQLREQCAQVRGEYAQIEARLHHLLGSPEQIDELKEYLHFLPPVLEEKDQIIHKIIQDYELFEKYKFPIEFDEFEEKWDLAMETCKILKLYDHAIDICYPKVEERPMGPEDMDYRRYYYGSMRGEGDWGE